MKNYLVDVTESVNAFLSSLKSQGAILAGKCFANKELNTGANIAEGKVYFDFEFTPAYPEEQVTFRAYLNNENIEVSIASQDRVKNAEKKQNKNLFISQPQYTDDGVITV